MKLICRLAAGRENYYNVQNGLQRGIRSTGHTEAVLSEEQSDTNHFLGSRKEKKIEIIRHGGTAPPTGPSQ